MFGFAWLTLRQAREAIKTGRLDEALRLLKLPALQNHRRTGELLVQLAAAYAERGERHLKREDAEQAWCDLLLAEGLQTGEKSTGRLRQALTGLGLAELRALLLAGDTARAEESVARLRHCGVSTVELNILNEGLRHWARARDLAGQGDLAPAAEAAREASRLLGVNPRLEAFHAELARNRARLPELLARLNEVALGGRWNEVLERAEAVLALAPQHAEARALRARAWHAVGPATVALPAPGRDEEAPDSADDYPPQRFWLWIDGVGGYLVCGGNRLTFGQALPDARVDVPLVADVSRLHATLSRDAEGYVLEAVRPVQVNNTTTRRALLQSNDRVTLGATCQFLFRLPVPGNSTARLDLVSGHRLPTSVDGVLLLAETLLLGPSEQSHVAISDLKKPVVLFRHRDGLGLRPAGEMCVNGQPCGGRTILPPAATVRGEDVSFAVEPAS
jgi:tetratricopeptide (TPR) repeat protein